MVTLADQWVEPAAEKTSELNGGLHGGEADASAVLTGYGAVLLVFVAY